MIQSDRACSNTVETPFAQVLLYNVYFLPLVVREGEWMGTKKPFLCSPFSLGLLLFFPCNLPSFPQLFLFLFIFIPDLLMSLPHEAPATLKTKAQRSILKTLLSRTCYNIFQNSLWWGSFRLQKAAKKFSLISHLCTWNSYRFDCSCLESVGGKKKAMGRD